MKNFAAIILAAGKGTRMCSDLPKVLHKAGGRAMLDTVCRIAAPVAEAGICIVIGHGGEQVRAAMGEDYLYAIQAQQLGTGHAVQQALPVFPSLPEHLMILCGDTPLLTAETIQALAAQHVETGADCTVMTAMLPDAGSYGRIVRTADGTVDSIVEAKDATPEQLKIREFNSGVYCFSSKALQEVIYQLTTDNAQGEYYLTDALAAIRNKGGKLCAYVCSDAVEVSGVNDRVQLAAADRVLRERKNRELMLSGVTMIDPSTCYIDMDVTVGQDTVLEPHVCIYGNSAIGSNCQIGPSVKIQDSTVGDRCSVGPFCYLRPGTVLEEQAKAGHFVEIKKSRVGKNSKVPHLAYIGDCEIGERVNIGCGTITCNYDGKNKYRTVIKDDAFIGSNSNLVAPVVIGERSTVAAGSTVTMDVPPNTLAVARGRQNNVDGWTELRDPRFRKK